MLVHVGILRTIGIAHLVRIRGAGFAGFRPVQQRVAGERFGDLGFQLDRGQLQQPDRLAQLWRQDQVLVQPGGKARLHPRSGYRLARTKNVIGMRISRQSLPGMLQSRNVSPRYTRRTSGFFSSASGAPCASTAPSARM
jgi:hypothetical protein